MLNLVPIPHLDVIIAISRSGHQSSATTGSNTSTLIAAGVISAVISAFVALLVEWLAKPRLEARKARILARHSAAQEIRVQLARILELSIRVSDFPRMTAIPFKEQAVLRRTYEGFIERTQAAVEALDSAILDTRLTTQLYSLMTGYLGFAKAALGSPDTYQVRFFRLGAGTLAVQRAIKTPSWIPRMKKKRIDMAEFIIRNPPQSSDPA
jgi:hypothetical protein